MVFGGLFRGFVPAFDPGGVVAAVPWWLSGGVAAANCLAAYTPKGAASLAASYDNNAAPGNGLADGTYDAALGVAPTFAAATGWTATGTEYLNTGIVVTTPNWTMISRFSDFACPPGVLMQLAGAGHTYIFRMSPDYGGTTWNRKAFRNGAGDWAPSGRVTSGVLAMAGGTGYYNGASLGTFTTGAGSTVYPVYMLAYDQSGSAAHFMIGKMQALAIYNTTLTPTQVAAVSTAMAAL